MIKLLFLDDHPVVSSGLASRYAATPGFAVVGTASTFREAIELAGLQATDLAVVDVQLATMLTPRQVMALAERCRVVLFSAHAADPSVKLLIAAGAAAAVDKAAALTELDAVLRRVHAGAPAPTPTAPSAAARTTRDVLSDREYEVYRALARCETPKEVSASLGIARSTVYCHIENIRRKLGVETLQEIVARALAETDRPARS